MQKKNLIRRMKMIRILVVDDDKNTRLYLEGVLEQNGYNVILAENGIKALGIMDGEHIDLVVLDVMMPQMDGYELTKTLRDWTIIFLYLWCPQSSFREISTWALRREPTTI